jgi:hypothetical protein
MNLDIITGFIAEHPGWILGIATAILIFTLILFLSVAGLFTRIEIKTQETMLGPMVMAYKTSVGSYKNSGDLFTESWSLLPHRGQIGLYYDDPQNVPENELRSAVGPILSKGNEKPVKDEMDLMIKHGYKIFHLPDPGFVVTTTFPFNTTLSFLIAIWRVYPRLKKYITEKSLCAYPAIEVYQAEEIVFMMPLSHQEEFFVTEFQDEQESVATTDMGSVITNDKDDDDLFLKPKTPVRVSRTSRRSVESSLAEAVNSLNTVSASGDGVSRMPSVMQAINGSPSAAVSSQPPTEDIFSEEPSDDDEELEEEASAGSTNESSSFDDLAEESEIK